MGVFSTSSHCFWISDFQIEQKAFKTTARKYKRKRIFHLHSHLYYPFHTMHIVYQGAFRIQSDKNKPSLFLQQFILKSVGHKPFFLFLAGCYRIIENSS